MSGNNSTSVPPEILQYTSTAAFAELDTEYDSSYDTGQSFYATISNEFTTLDEPLYDTQLSNSELNTIIPYTLSINPPGTLSDSVSILRNLTSSSAPISGTQPLQSFVPEETGVSEVPFTSYYADLTQYEAEITTSSSSSSSTKSAVLSAYQPSVSETLTHPTYNGTVPYAFGGSISRWNFLGENSVSYSFGTDDLSHGSHIGMLSSVTTSHTSRLGEKGLVSVHSSLPTSSSIPMSTLVLTLVSTSTMSTDEPVKVSDADDYKSTYGQHATTSHAKTDDSDSDDEKDNLSTSHSETASTVTRTLFHTSTTSATAHYSYSTDKSHKYFIFDQMYDFTDATTSFTTGIPTTLTIPRDSPTSTFSVPTNVLTRPASFYKNWLDTGSLNLPDSKFASHRASNQVVIGSVVGSIVGAVCLSVLIYIIVFVSRRRRYKGSDDKKEEDPFLNEFVFRDRAATNANLMQHPGLDSSGEFGDIHRYDGTDTPSKDLQTLDTEPLSYSRPINNGAYAAAYSNHLRNQSLRSDMRSYNSRSYSEYDSPISEFSYEFVSDDNESGPRANTLHNTDSLIRNDQSLFREVI